MDKKDVLERSRMENRNKDELEKYAFGQAGLKAAAVGGVMCTIIILFEAIYADFVSMGTWAVYLSMTGTMFLVKFSLLGKRHELIIGLLQLTLAIIFLVLYMKRVAG